MSSSVYANLIAFQASDDGRGFMKGKDNVSTDGMTRILDIPKTQPRRCFRRGHSKAGYPYVETKGQAGQGQRRVMNELYVTFDCTSNIIEAVLLVRQPSASASAIRMVSITLGLI
ncbi:hypothetical protein N7539_004132 [Penicillium diatomitis]|uniref:Uncharacterized protein n=1 Tax=Penicillium diatomitis TaxID=2819901 RepID=A0A9W9XDE6_9EURO|nr:uncharacterized protein N7539_004132 [Penicillium diatomitis]KAJ5489242.1 hypothetical protein N7539_004132 [Penicillium diatomitis]